MPDSPPEHEVPDPDPVADDESPTVERRWRPTADAPFHVPASSEADAATEEGSAPLPDAPPGDEEAAQDEHDPTPPEASTERAPVADQNPGGPVLPEDARTEGSSSTDASSTTAPDGVSGEASRSGSGGGTPTPNRGDRANRPSESRPAPSAVDESEQTLPPAPDGAEDAAREGHDEALAEAPSDESWIDHVQEPPQVPSDQDENDDEDFFTDQRRRASGAERVEEELQAFAYEVNDGTADTDWTPSKQRDHRIAAMFARLVSKVAEDMSYQQVPGDEFWDPRKIMRRQIDRRPLQHCKMDYTKRRLALLVDTSPSCRDEAVFYSKVATGALLRDDIDIFLCPNGRIDAKFDPEPMRFVQDDRGVAWDLEGRVVLYFTDWDGTDEIVEHSRDCTLYWFDNCPPSKYWESARDRHQRVRLQYRGQHFHCPDPDAFRRLARKIRP
ncbi:hypothetical protein [Salinibacter altiplanensis]|uniref:hypothetical protein n=1 Tax=Salinibacter altiplanensis TaxID=1803181 RepID=UPI000C9F323F|nr:hypothetical protein [Salinibacter altiplanensis]